MTHLAYARIVYYFPNEQLHFNCIFWEYPSTDEIQCTQPSRNECDHHSCHRKPDFLVSLLSGMVAAVFLKRRFLEGARSQNQLTQQQSPPYAYPL